MALAPCYPDLMWWMSLSVALAGLPDVPWVVRPPPTDGSSQGEAYVEPDAVPVFEKVTIEVAYTVGDAGMQAGDALRLEDPVLHGMRTSKWTVPSTDPSACSPIDPPEPSGSLVSVVSCGDATCIVRRSTDVADLNAFAYTEIELLAGSIAPGEQLRVRFGDTAFGADCGWQTSERAFHAVEWRVWELLDDDGWVLVKPIPTYSYSPREEPWVVHAAVPSQAVAGEPVRLKVAVLDAFGNPLEAWSGALEVSADFGGERAELSAGAPAWHDFTVVFASPGVYRVPVRTSDGLEALSNPIEVTSTPPARSVYWGDIHTHHGWTTLMPDGTWVDENIVYARDVVGLDVSSETTKGLPLEIDGPILWEELRENCSLASEPGRFVSLLGWEWMGASAHGHHNVYYDGCDADLGLLGIPNLADEGGLWDFLEEQEATYGVRGISVPHATLYTGFDWFRAHEISPERDDKFRPAAEVYSAWGSSMEPAELEGSVPRALSRGLKLGFIASSDNHIGWMGNPFWSEKNALPGLAAFVAPELSHDAVFDALVDRTTYATTGERILVSWTLEDGDTKLIAGGTHHGKHPTLSWSVHGTSALSRLRVLAIEIDEGAQVRTLYEMTPPAWDIDGSLKLSNKAWEGNDMAVWLQVDQVDGASAWTSPFYVSRGCGGGDAWALLVPLPLLALRRRRRAA